MEYIKNKLRRYTTFSKRKSNIMKKAYELSTLTGTQVGGSRTMLECITTTQWDRPSPPRLEKWGSTIYRGVLISGGWNREVPLYTEVSSFQGVGIEEFHCIQRYPYFRRLE